MTGLDAVLKTAADWPVPTVAAAVVGPSGVLSAYGPVDQSFPLASVTKPLAALTVLVAVEEGALELDDPAGPPGSTVRHLLAHASGLSPDSADRVMAPPGDRRIYSNAGFEVLGAHLEQATGLRMEEYADALCGPLGMRRTVLAGSPAKDGRSTVSDLALLAVELLRPGTVLAPETVAAATSVQFEGLAGVLPGFGRQARNDWGLGLELRAEKTPHWTGRDNSPRTYGHFGQSGTFLWVDPDADLACVALTDRDFDTWAAECWPVFSDAVLGAV